jgi:hypothetical protein
MNFSKVNICEDLKEIYKEAISLYNNDDSWKMNVLIFQSDYENLKLKWNNVSSAVSMCYQADVNDENEFEKWNLYIIYVCSEKVDKELKAQIENNKFSSRKIIADNQTEKLTDDIVNDLIIKNITNTDLVEAVNNTKENIEKKYNPKNTAIWDLIPKGESVLRNKDLQKQIIKQLKKVKYEN